ncbi:MAG: radical SAM protein [Candidatus Fermentibacteria bacterium]
MRILMVKGYSFNREVPQYSYPLGLMYMASHLRLSQPDHEIEILDLRCHRHPYDLLQKRLQTWDPEVVAISALTCEAESLHRTAAMVRERNPKAVIMVGGPHISACTNDVAEDPNIDVLVTGEGETAFTELIRRISIGESIQGIPGTASRADGKLEWGAPGELIADLDTIPFPAWDLVDIKKYAHLGRAGNVRRGRYLPIFTSRGCPYRCFYCHNVFGKKFRYRSAENVVEEIKQIVEKFGITDIEVYDDIFNLDLDRAKLICNKLLELDLGLSLAFPNGVRADQLDQELVNLLAEAGTTNLAVAVETASPDLQKTIGKNLDIERVKTVISWADEAGIVTNGYFMIGFPGETAEQVRKTIAYAETTDLFFASFFIVTPYPGTPLWDQTMSAFDSSSLDFSNYNYLSGYFNLSEMSGDELRLLQKEAYRRFYSKKRWKIIKSIPRLRIDYRNAVWLWLGRMKDRAGFRAHDS